jgi:FAS-associated factor 2
MASPDFDLGQLNESQQLALQQYMSVTDQELQAAISLLSRSEWNVQVRYIEAI